MIATLIILIVIISVMAIISFTMLTFNHNMTTLNKATETENEITMIKQSLIANALPINSDNDYSLLAGENNNGIHLLPNNLGLPIKNTYGYYYIYCPYSQKEIDISNNQTVESGNNTNYLISTTSINDLNYVTGSSPAPSLQNSPEIAAIILSKIKDNRVSCSDIKYDVSSNNFYVPNTKVSVITKNEINTYYTISDLSTKKQELQLNETNKNEIFNILKNDISNKNYNIKLNDDINLSDNILINKKIDKKSFINFDYGIYDITGTGSLTFNNVDVTINGINDFNMPTTSYPILNTNNSQIFINNAKIGGLNIENSELKLNNTLIYNTMKQKGLVAKDSKIITTNKNIFQSNDSLNNNNLLDLTNSKYILNGTTEFGFYGYNPNSFMNLKNSDVVIYGTLNQLDSKKSPQKVFIIDQNSELNLLGGIISFLGKASWLNGSFYPIELEGILYANNNAEIYTKTRNSYMNGLINGKNGAELRLADVTISGKGVKTPYPIHEDMTNGKGFSRISGTDNVDIYGSVKCWSGYLFSNTNGVEAISTSQTDKVNNFSNWNCHLPTRITSR